MGRSFQLVRSFCRWAKPVEIKLRPKGLGLGAEVQSSTQKEHMEQAKRSNDAAVPLIVKCGAYVKILRGSHEGKYGQVGDNCEAGACFYQNEAILLDAHDDHCAPTMTWSRCY